MELGNEIVTRIRAPLVVSSRGERESRDWANAAETDISGCMIQPMRISNRLLVEDTAEREFTLTFYRGWFPPGTDIEPTDRFRWKGRTYEVQGFPGPWDNFQGTEEYVSCLLKIRSG